MRFDWSPIEMFIVCLPKQKSIYIQFIYPDIFADQWGFSASNISRFQFQKLSKSVNVLWNHQKFKNLSTIFNTEWHKIGVQVEESSVSLFVDCAKMETVQLGSFTEFTSHQYNNQSWDHPGTILGPTWDQSRANPRTNLVIPGVKRANMLIRK